MIGTNWRPKLTALVTSVAFLCGCAASLEYRHGKAKPVVSAQEPAKLMMADIVDGREREASSDLPLVYKRTQEQSFTELRRAARKHAKRAGLVTRDAMFVAAPSNPAELEQALAQARAAGADALLITRLEGLYADGKLSAAHGLLIISSYIMFIGLVPMLIGCSIPLSAEYAAAEVGAFLVDPETGLVFASYEKSFVYEDPKVTVWGYGPSGELKDVLFNTMQQVFEEAARIMNDADPKSGPQIAIATVLFGDAPRERNDG